MVLSAVSGARFLDDSLYLISEWRKIQGRGRRRVAQFRKRACKSLPLTKEHGIPVHLQQALELDGNTDDGVGGT